MPRTAATGAYAAPSSSFNPAVDNTVISSTDWNTLLADLATALSTGAATTRALWPTAAQIQDSTLTTLTAVGGTADVITATAPLSMAAYVAGQTFTFIATGNNTTVVTINMNGIGPKSITKSGTTPLAANDIVSGGLIVIRYDGTQFQLMNLNPSGSVAMQSFTTTGTYTPTSGMRYCVVHMVGGGAGGATMASGNYGGGGGGAGEYATGLFTASAVGASNVVTIGTAGAANGGAGGTTSLGTLLTAVGGGANATASTGGPGGTGGTGTGFHVPGGNGATGSPATATPLAVGGSGGASWFGSGGIGGEGGLGNGGAGAAYGSGGGGNGYAGSWSTGGVGTIGAIIIYEYL